MWPRSLARDAVATLSNFPGTPTPICECEAGFGGARCEANCAPMWAHAGLRGACEMLAQLTVVTVQLYSIDFVVWVACARCGLRYPPSH